MEYFGKRIRNIRKDLYKKTQTEFANMVNVYIKSKGIPETKENLFTQYYFTSIEIGKVSTGIKLIHLLNFLYDTKRINPSWLTLRNNKSNPKFITKIVIDNDLIEIHKEMESKTKDLLKYVNDVRIIIDNTNH